MLPLNALTDATPNQNQLLALLKNATQLHPAQARLAKDLLEMWYPFAYRVWVDNQASC